MAYYERQRERDKLHNKMMQQLENEKIDKYIERQARRWIEEDRNKQVLGLIDGKPTFMGGIKIMTPEFSAVMIYDEETAKYRSGDINQAVRDRYNELKALEPIPGEGIYCYMKRTKLEDMKPSDKLALNAFNKLADDFFNNTNNNIDESHK